MTTLNNGNTSKQDNVLFEAFVALSDELLTPDGQIHVPELLDRMMDYLATKLQKTGDKAYVRHTCEKLGLSQPLYGACVMKGDEKAEVNHLPPMLATTAAMELWKRLQEAGYVDENYQKLPSLSWAVASIIAHEIADKLQLPNIWQPFEIFWQHKGLRKNYDGALSTNKKFVDIELNIKKILSE